ncbi:transposase [Phenylobacterium sp.]|uniref:transposase n=1 Tax=Phenylobacterium sp. TaxID=1871053 RepID=UPI0025E37895|nr:transposase [Phenylobacterium sp.]
MAFGRFVGRSLEDEVPDHTTLCRFCDRLVSAKLLERLFGAILIEAATSRPRRGKAGSTYGDKAYDTPARRARLKRQGVKPRLMRPPSQYHALTRPESVQTPHNHPQNPPTGRQDTPSAPLRDHWGHIAGVPKGELSTNPNEGLRRWRLRRWPAGLPARP